MEIYINEILVYDSLTLFLRTLNTHNKVTQTKLKIRHDNMYYEKMHFWKVGTTKEVY